MLDPITSIAFAIHENKGVFALLLGSGTSRAALIPTGWEITTDLIRRIAKAEGVADQTDWPKWFNDQHGQKPEYSTLLDMLSATQEERRALLHSYIEPNQPDHASGHKVPTKAHRAIARLVRDGYVRVIVTTNFDRLIENALREEGIEPTVVSNADNARGAVPLTHNVCLVLKLHGDYLDTRILNTETELHSYPAELDSFLDRILDEFGLIVCGWSAEWDFALRAAIERCASRRYSTFWTVRGTPAQFASALINHRRARLIPITDADSFFDQVQARVSLIESSKQQAPESVELLVQAAKRYVAKADERDQLNDLLAAEYTRAVSRRDAINFDVLRSGQEVLPLIVANETAFEGLVRIVGVLGRYGDGSELPLATSLMRQLASSPAASGVVSLINLRRYPALLIFYGFGIGLLKSGRYRELHQWLAHPMPHPWQDSMAAVNATEDWKPQQGSMSAHLFSLFEDWSRDYMMGHLDFEDAFPKFEVLAALASWTAALPAETIEASSQPSPNNGIPYTRYSNILATIEAITTLMREVSGVLREPLLAAGFANGNSNQFDILLANLSAQLAHGLRFRS
jgi:hypothetical protein